MDAFEEFLQTIDDNEYGKIGLAEMAFRAGMRAAAEIAQAEIERMLACQSKPKGMRDDMAESINTNIRMMACSAATESGERLVELDKSVFGRAMNVYVETLEKAKAGDAESIRSICDAAARIFAVANEGRSP